MCQKITHDEPQMASSILKSIHHFYLFSLDSLNCGFYLIVSICIDVQNSHFFVLILIAGLSVSAGTESMLMLNKLFWKQVQQI